MASPRRPTVAALLTAAIAVVALLWPVHGQVNVPTVPTPIARGGTGQITQTAAFNALSPLTTRGDIITRDASNNVRFAKCTSSQILGWGANDPTCRSMTAADSYVWVGGKSAGYPVADFATTPAFYLYWEAGPVISSTDPTATAPTAATTVTPIAITPITITRIDFSIVNAVTSTSSETGSMYVRVNNTTDTVIFNNTLNWNGTPTNTNNFSAAGLSISLATNDFWTLKIVPPNFATNPTNTWYIAKVYTTSVPQ